MTPAPTGLEWGHLARCPERQVGEGACACPGLRELAARGEVSVLFLGPAHPAGVSTAGPRFQEHCPQV